MSVLSMLGAKAGALGQEQLGIFLGPLDRKAAYRANAFWAQPGLYGTIDATPSVYQLLPDPSAMIQVYHSGWGTYQGMRELMLNHGIPMRGDAYWSRLIDMARPRLNLLDALYIYRRQEQVLEGLPTIERQEIIDRACLAGFGDPKERDLVLNPFYQWSLDDARKLLAIGKITQTQFTNLVRAAGYSRQVDFDFASALIQGLDLPSMWQLYWRGQLSNNERDRFIALAGYTDPAVRTLLTSLAVQRPDPIEMNQLGTRNVWDETFAAQYTLDSGLDQNPWVPYWSAANGFEVNATPLPDQPSGSTDWARLRWRASRRLPGFGEATLMQHRLRPTGGKDNGPRVNGVAPWTGDDTRAMLSASGVPPAIVDRFLGLVYEPISIRHVHAILEEVIRSPKDYPEIVHGAGDLEPYLSEVVQDYGLSPDNARVFARALITKTQRTVDEHKIANAIKARAERRSLLVGLYEAGTMTQQQLAQALQGPEVDGATAGMMAENAEIGRQLKVIESQVALIRKSYMRGALSDVEASNSLTSMGIAANSVAIHLAQWSVERDEERTMLSTGDILRLLREGLITPQLAQARLLNLGWDNGDALVEIAQVEADLVRAAALAAEKQHALAVKEATAQAQAQAREKARAEIMAVKEARGKATANWDAAIASSKFFENFAKQHQAYEKALNKDNTDAQTQAQWAIVSEWLKSQRAINEALFTGPPEAGVPGELLDVAEGVAERGTAQ